MMTLIAALPLLVFLGLVLVVKKTVLSSAGISFILVVGIALFVWGVDIARIASASIKGVFLAVDIAFIVFGSLFIFESLKKKDLFVFIKKLFEAISVDRRVHISLVAWGLVYFLEGVAGFGTPIMIAAPILVVLGFSPLAAVTLSLIGDAVPDIFGAIGLPITLGINSTLSAVGADPGLLREISLLISGFNIVGSIIIPILMLFVFARIENKPLSHVIEFIPFAIFGGLSASITSFLTVYFIGPDLAAVIGGLVSMIVIAVFARYRILLPKTEESEAMRPIPTLVHERANTIKAISPYVIIFILLLVSRLPFDFVKKVFIDFFKVDIPSLFGFSINYSFSPFYAAGILILISAFVSAFIMRLSVKDSFVVMKDAGLKTVIPFSALALVLMFVQTYVYSAENSLGIPSMLETLGAAASHVFGPIWPLVAPFIGALGSFTVGSTTVSNLIFSGLQYETALLSGFSPALILALQGLGAAAGGIIAFHNVLPALAVVGLAGNENKVIRQNMLTLFIYLFCITAIGFVVSVFGWV